MQHAIFQCYSVRVCVCVSVYLSLLHNVCVCVCVWQCIYLSLFQVELPPHCCLREDVSRSCSLCCEVLCCLVGRVTIKHRCSQCRASLAMCEPASWEVMDDILSDLFASAASLLLYIKATYTQYAVSSCMLVPVVPESRAWWM